MKLDPEITPPEPFILSVEPCKGETYKHGYHLGTDEKVAKEFAQEVFKRVNTETGCYTVALMRNGRIFDVFDGRDWINDGDY
jgi:uncharacterized protein (UPF0254 family)